MPGSKSKQRLERRHRRLPPIVPKHELIQINLELIAADTVVGTDQPLLEIANGAVCQRHHGLRAFAQIDPERLITGQVPKSGFLQSCEALQSVGIYR